MKISIEVIPHKDQRYDTAGDWQFHPEDSKELTDGWLSIRVSDTGYWKSNMLIAVHELVEAILCKAHGVSQETVDKWDMGTGKALQEPGNDPRAPYHAEHVVAEGVEAIVGSHLKIEWLEHTHNVWNLELPDDLKRSSDLPSERTGD